MLKSFRIFKADNGWQRARSHPLALWTISFNNFYENDRFAVDHRRFCGRDPRCSDVIVTSHNTDESIRRQLALGSFLPLRATSNDQSAVCVR